MISFKGKKGLVLGIANQRSIAYAVAQTLNSLGAEMAFTYGPDTKGRFKQNVEELAQGMNVSQILQLDVRDDGQIETLFSDLNKAWTDGMDFLVHSVAFADRSDLEIPFSQTNRKGWETAFDVSAYSMVPLARHACPMMEKRGGGVRWAR
ncbi:MAG: SDR family oxidoreductase, partial [Deltaproteobacteria bacterium]|nr:SDR family oxidoreductase [Deltaproteobacteria bacterium]